MDFPTDTSGYLPTLHITGRLLLMGPETTSLTSNLTISSLMAILNFLQFLKHTKSSFSPVTHSSLSPKPSSSLSVSAGISLGLLLKYHLLGGACPGTSPWSARWVPFTCSPSAVDGPLVVALFYFWTLGEESSEHIIPISLCALLACFIHLSLYLHPPNPHPILLSPLKHPFWCAGCTSININISL